MSVSPLYQSRISRLQWLARLVGPGLVSRLLWRLGIINDLICDFERLHLSYRRGNEGYFIGDRMVLQFKWPWDAEVVRLLWWDYNDEVWNELSKEGGQFYLNWFPIRNVPEAFAAAENWLPCSDMAKAFIFENFDVPRRGFIQDVALAEYRKKEVMAKIKYKRDPKSCLLATHPKQ